MKHHGETFSLANGVAIPCLGFGTWQMKEGPETVAAIQKALELGYRHIDTAAYYQNERSVGQAVRASGLPREAVFVTSKVWNTDRGYESTLRAFDRTMEKLGLDYLDLYLIHWPAAANRFDNWEDINGQTWRAMTELYQQGRVRAIGVSLLPTVHEGATVRAMEKKGEPGGVQPRLSAEANPGLLPGPWHPGGGVESPGIGPCAGECDLAGPGKAVWEVRRADLPALVPGAGGPASAQVGDPPANPGKHSHF